LEQAGVCDWQLERIEPEMEFTLMIFQPGATCKKGYQFSRPQLGCHLTKLFFLAGNNLIIPGRESLVK
jgi:hypothetical protein